ncbi:MAG: 4'-phosphopantetheinyl transferase superfamily protein [Blautia sp.]|nr:4'-phosphopantetheinyl transferase superfamily protein [Blautia sp.]
MRAGTFPAPAKQEANALVAFECLHRGSLLENGMLEKRYLLNIGRMLESGGDVLFREAFDRMDRERRQKVLSLKNIRARAACTGAGLLIQKALKDYRVYCRTECGSELGAGCLEELWIGSRAEPRIEPWAEPDAGWAGTRIEPWAEPPELERFSVEELLLILGRDVAENRYRYGNNGKPYLLDVPLQFNISHSGDYVFCGVSEREIGVDIQKIQGDRALRLARRFFADPERRALEACGDGELRQKMFFRMWVRKEAYGKLTGEGIAGVMGKCFWEDVSAGEEAACAEEKGLGHEDGLVWEEYDEPEGYRMAVCRFWPETYGKTG